jgi:hypothetical protein
MYAVNKYAPQCFGLMAEGPAEIGRHVPRQERVDIVDGVGRRRLRGEVSAGISHYLHANDDVKRHEAEGRRKIVVMILYLRERNFPMFNSTQYRIGFLCEVEASYGD